MSVIYPEAVTSQGNKKVIIVTTAPTNPAAPTVTQLAAGIESTMYFLGQYAPTGSQTKGSAPRRVGENSQLERLGNITYASPTLSYLHDPQGAPAATANRVKAALAEDAVVWIYSRAGLDAESASAVGNKLRLDHVKLGHQWAVPSGDDEFAVETITQETGYQTNPIEATVAV